MARVVVVGAGIVGAACAFALSADGHAVTVVDRGGLGAGTTSRGEGNILVSDKGPGPELDLARWSARLWRELGAELGVDDIELEAKGGLVVAADEASAAGLATFAESQSAAGVSVEPVAASELSSFEPQLADGLLGGAYYPEDQQVQPVRAAAALLRAARRRGAVVRFGVRVSGIRTDGRGAVAGVLTDAGPLGADVVVNAAGTWGGTLSERFGAPVPVLPRRGFILVTEPMPPVVRHKVYSADYTANVASSDAGLQTSVVVEATKAGTVLIGASRERVGFNARRRLSGGESSCGAGGAAVPGARRHLAAAGVPGLSAVLSRPSASDRPRPPGRGVGPRLRARGGWDRARAGDRRADRRSAGRADPGARPDTVPAGTVRRDGRRGVTGTAFTFDGERVEFRPGQSVGAALIAAGIRSWRSTRFSGRPRGVFCGIGVCFDCLVVVDGRPNERACRVTATADMEVSTQEGTGHDGLAR